MSLQFLYRTGCLKLKRHKTTLNIIGSLSLNVSLSCTYLLLSPYSAVAQPISYSLLLPSLMRCLNNVSFGVTKRRRLFAISSSLEAVGEPTIVKVGQVTEVNKDTFWPIVEVAGEKTVVLDMYTQWNGPCKVIAPRFKELSEKYLNVVFLKLDCNQKNEPPLAKELGIRVVPTFKILKDNKIVKEVTGAKFDDLVCY